MGQSLYSSHLNAVYGHNHAFIDPNIWYDEPELRKQIEQFAGCFILTAQETPETTRRMREDLYKKTMSADGIAGRRPYGYVTRMIELTGWKRMEVNRLMQFKGASEKNFWSILRRSFIWRPHARFVALQYLEDNYPDAEQDGYFPKDPSLKDFLVSGPAIASSLQLQHAFESTHSREECLQLIESYCNLGGDQGLTEDKMRAACNLPPRRRHETSAPGLGPVDDPASQEQADELKAELDAVQRRIVDECLSKGVFYLTVDQFKRMSLPARAPNLDRETMLKQLEDYSLAKEIVRQRGKSKRWIVPCVMGTRSLLDVVDLKTRKEPPLVYPEVWNISGLRNFAAGHLSREHNVVTLTAFLKKGPGKMSSDAKIKFDKDTERRKKLEATEVLIGKFMACSSQFEMASENIRHHSKQQLREGKAKYKQTIPDIIRGRKYVCGLGAQQCSRKVLMALCPRTVDLAFWCQVQQFVFMCFF